MSAFNKKGKRPLPEESGSSLNKRQEIDVDEHDDDEVQVLTPQKSQQQAVNLLSDSPSAKGVDDAWGNVQNPNIVYIHARSDCGVHIFQEDPLAYCEKCYCVVCQKPAKDCKEWTEHCHITSQQAKKMRPKKDSRHHQEEESRHHQEQEIQRIYRAINMFEERREERRREKATSEMRITEVLARNLAKSINLADGINIADSENQTHEKEKNLIADLKMEGDIGELRLHNSFFVEGIKIGWPFPAILSPQRQMAIHIIRALKRKLHVVLESPTGTGKSAAILCSVLAWQRYHAQRQEGANSDVPPLSFNESGEIEIRPRNTVPTIIYCSRTHSQVAQMVASLKKTPYRPRMTVLGSRQRLCINRDLIGKKGVNINLACRDRKRETDSRRQAMFKSNSSYYDDNNPHIPKKRLEDEPLNSQKEQEPIENATEGDAATGSRNHGQEKPICPHYMHLTSEKTVMGIQSRFVPDTKRIGLCAAGGEHSSLGVHDIEDLVQFGKNPYLERNIAIYRKGGEGSFGINLADRKDGGVEVIFLRQDSPAARDGRLLKNDWVVKVNGQDTKNWKMDKVCDMIRALPKDPLVIDVLRGMGIDSAMGDDSGDANDEPYSEDAHCPYYVSRALKNHANLVFAPYNYVLDPTIRKSLQISLEGAVVVLDEAHNVEDTLKESGSGDFGEMDLCALMAKLSELSCVRAFVNSETQNLEIPGTGETIMYPKAAHELLVFLERLVIHMRELRLRFEKGPGLEKVKAEHSRFHLPDDHEVEVKYSGPSGWGFKGEAVGCAPLLKELGITPQTCSRLLTLCEALESHIFSKLKQNDAILKDVTTFLERLSLAAKNSEHFFMAFVVKPNGNIDYATGMDDNAYADMTSRNPWKKNPRKIPYVGSRNDNHPNEPLPSCHHEPCRRTHNDDGYLGQAIRHGDFCNGEIPLWESRLVLRLLSPGLQLKELSDKCRSIIFASGSLAPLPSLCAELNLYGPKPKQTPSQNSPLADKKGPRLSQSSLSQGPPKKLPEPRFGRLQTGPKPLEANHVVNLPKQLLAVSIGHFPDGSPLTVTYAHYKEASFFPKLGHAVATVVESVPRGGILLFFPSYSFLKKCIKCWKPTMDQTRFNHVSPQIWQRLLRAKGKVIVEPTGSQEKFDEARKEYTEKIKEDGNCILLAVFRGKMSEGISFNDDNARCVICVGLPYPSFNDRAVKAKRSYNDEQRKIRKNTNLLPGDEWYAQQAHRAIAQALGRCIRHGADYGCVVLLDSRHCDDGRPNDGMCEAHKKMPKWMRASIRTLSMQATGGVGQNPVLGGYNGLKQNLRQFFQDAPAQSRQVREEWKVNLEKAQALSRGIQEHSFDRDTGCWTYSPSKK